MRAWIDVATLAHTKSLDGRLVAKAASGLPFLLEEGMECALVPPVLDAPRRVHVSAVAFRGDREALVGFAEVTDPQTAQMIVGCHCLARRAELDLERLRPQGALPSWEGWTVHDARAGFVGHVAKLHDRPMQPLLVVSREGAPDALIPLAEEFIADVDEQRRLIVLECPPGLLDL